MYRRLIKHFAIMAGLGSAIIVFLGYSSSSLQGREQERGVESNKADLDVKTQRSEDAKRHSLLLLMKFDLFRKIVDVLS